MSNDSINVERGGWGIWSPFSYQFHHAEQIFYENLSKSKWHWRQVAVLVATVAAALFFIVGAFPAFCWVTHTLKLGEDEAIGSISEVATKRFPVQSPSQKRVNRLLPVSLDSEKRSEYAEQIETRNKLELKKDSTKAEDFLPKTCLLDVELKEQREVFPAIWLLLPSGELNHSNQEKPLLEVLQFLEKNPLWVKNEINKECVKAYFVQLIKTDFSTLKDRVSFFSLYQTILSQHESIFIKEVYPENSSLLVSLKLGDKIKSLPKNLLVMQSPIYLAATKHKNFNSVIDFGIMDKGEHEEESRISEDIDAIFNYLLAGKIEITEENVLSLLDYAHRNQLMHLQEECLKFLLSIFDSLDLDDYNEVVHPFITSRYLDQDLCRLLCEENFFGSQDWKKYCGDVGKVPPLPKDIFSILTSDFQGSKVYQTHLLVLVPEQIDGKNLTPESLEAWVKAPKESGNGYSSAYRYFSSDVFEKIKGNCIPSHWVLMTKNAIETKEDKPYSIIERLKQTLELINDDEGKLMYEIPSVRDMVVCLFMYHIKTGKRLFGNYPYEYAYCSQDFLNVKKPFKEEELMLVGGYSPSGVRVASSRFNFKGSGVAGSRKLSQ